MAGEACRKAKEENGRLADERLALIMEAKFDSSGESLFNNGYACCVFTQQHTWKQALDSGQDAVSLSPVDFRVLRQSPLPIRHVGCRSCFGPRCC